MTYEEILCDANNLYKAYRASVKTSKWKESTQNFMLNYLRNIFSIQNDLQNRTLKNSRAEEFVLHERGRIRQVTSIPVRDRIIRHVLCDELLLPEVKKKIIYDNGASIKGRGMSFARKRFDVHLRKYYSEHGCSGYILFGDFTKFYDNIVHETAKRDLLGLFNNDSFMEWLFDVIFDGFEIDVSYMSEEEYTACIERTFNKLEHNRIPKRMLTGEKFMEKSVNIGDQISQVIGIYYPHRIDNYIKYVRSQKYYGRYMDDWYIMSPSKEELADILEHVRVIAKELGIHMNDKKTRIVRINRPFRYLQITYRLTEHGKIIKKINPKRVTEMRRKLKKLAAKVETGELAYDRVETMFKSWMGSFYKLMSRTQRRNMIILYERLFRKRIEVVGKKLAISDNL